MSGPNPPGADSEDLGRGNEPGGELNPGVGAGADNDLAADAAERTGETDFFSQAYSAPESEQFSSGPYLPVDLDLYDYDSYETADDEGDGGAPRWPWVVGVAAILAAVALVVSVSLLFARTDTNKLATPQTAAPSSPPFQDEISVTTAPPPPPPPPSHEPPPPPPPSEVPPPSPEPPPPPPPTNEAPGPVPAPAPSAPPATSSAAAPPPTTPAGPRQVTYSVTGTKAPGDIITVTYVDASGRRRTQHNVYIPWSITVTPISQSEVGSVEASSLFRLSRLNCSITTSDGAVLSSNAANAPQTSC
jgi:hypothetical protein